MQAIRSNSSESSDTATNGCAELGAAIAAQSEGLDGHQVEEICLAET
jgi:hypothetical protein